MGRAENHGHASGYLATSWLLVISRPEVYDSHFPRQVFA